MKSDEWTTPQALYLYLHKKCKFNVDAAANYKNTKCRTYFSKQKSFLKHYYERRKKTWRIWANPPYTLDRYFAESCYLLYRMFRIPSVLLLPVRSDRIWYNRISKSKGVRVIPFTGRIHFGNADTGAFMYSVLFVIGFKEVSFPDWIDAGQFNKGKKGSATT